MSQCDGPAPLPPPHHTNGFQNGFNCLVNLVARVPQHNGWYNCYFADSLGKIQYLQLSGDSSEPGAAPTQNLLDDIFLFLTFHVRSLALSSVAPHVLFPYNQWLAVTLRMSLCSNGDVFVAQIFSDQSEIFFVVTLKYFFREIIQTREPSLGTV